jgi:hypothetical protein
VIFDDHHSGTSMPSGGHPPHQLVASLYEKPPDGEADGVKGERHKHGRPD